MNLNEILAYVELGFQAMSEMMEMLGNLPNIIFISIGLIMIGIWLFLQANFPKEQE